MQDKNNFTTPKKSKGQYRWMLINVIAVIFFVDIDV